MIISHSAPLASTFLRHQGLPSPSLLRENMFEATGTCQVNHFQKVAASCFLYPYVSPRHFQQCQSALEVHLDLFDPTPARFGYLFPWTLREVKLPSLWLAIHDRATCGLEKLQTEKATKTLCLEPFKYSKDRSNAWFALIDLTLFQTWHLASDGFGAFCLGTHSPCIALCRCSHSRPKNF